MPRLIPKSCCARSPDGFLGGHFKDSAYGMGMARCVVVSESPGARILDWQEGPPELVKLACEPETNASLPVPPNRSFSRIFSVFLAALVHAAIAAVNMHPQSARRASFFPVDPALLSTGHSIVDCNVYSLALHWLPLSAHFRL